MCTIDNFAVLLILLSAVLAAASDCLPIREASQHVGETKCVTGKVLRVKAGAKGVHFVDFCEDQMACPFTVVVFASDLKDVGDVRRLARRVIEIHGPVKLYNGRAEIILNRVSQLTGGTTLIPPLPKNYDVEKQATTARAGCVPPAAAATFGNEADASEPPL
ncbi:MAG: hypothetical protein WB660_28615 [Candidatus Sulfotelmatobacter sp.]